MITIVTSPDNDADVFRIAFLFHPIMAEDNVVNHTPGGFDLLESQPVDAGTLVRLLHRVKANPICVIRSLPAEFRFLEDCWEPMAK